MPSRVWVTFKALNGDIDPSERVVELDIDHPSIQIGRASKTLSKGLQGARNNTWFDSPVMSRDHAELVFDAETDTLCVTDIGSMHGTILNGNQITPHDPSELNDGDNLVFGAEVRRGFETFPACSFRVSFEFGPYRPTNTYAFPESSEVDEEEEFNFSENASEDEPTSDDDLSIASSRPKISQSINAIDLTRDESPVYSSHPSIDLTADSLTVRRSEIIIDDKPTDASPNQSQAINTTNIGYGAPDLEETEEEEEMSHFSSSEEDDENDHISPFDEPEPIIEDSEDNVDAVNSIYDYDSEFDVVVDPIPVYEKQPSIPAYESSHENSAINDTAASSIDANAQTDGEHNDFGLQEAVDQAMRVMINHNFTNVPPPRLPFSSQSFAIQNVPDFDAQSSLTINTYTTVQDRQPSPSDAAMAKGPQTKPFHRSFTPNHASFKSLGDGTGKEAFFRAREENKVLVQGAEKQREEQEPKFETSTTTVGQPSRIVTLRDFQTSSQISPQIQLHQSLINEDSEILSSPNTSTGPFDYLPHSAFIAQSSALELPKLPLSPPAKPVESLLNTTKQPFRPALRIDEIIDRTPPERNASTLKRKAEEISVTMEDEVRAWASTSKSSEISSAATAAADTAPAIPSTELSRTLESRPAKRLRKVIENVAYAALGGVAVGAALFGGLVATAPDFM